MARCFLLESWARFILKGYNSITVMPDPTQHGAHIMTTTEHIVIHGIQPGKPYRSKHRYTPEQAAEIREITIKTAQTQWDEIDPDWKKVVATPLVGQESDG